MKYLRNLSKLNLHIQSRKFATEVNTNFLLKNLNLQSQNYSTESSTNLDAEILAKYKAKLEAKAKKEGLPDIETLIEKTNINSSPSPIQVEGNEVKSKSNVSKKKVERREPKSELDQIMKLDKLESLDEASLHQIWTEFHKTKSQLSAVIPKDQYLKLHKSLTKYPQFVLPLPKGESGSEIYYLQVNYHTVYFTPLEHYKLHKEKAKPSLVLNHYVELIDSHNSALMRGELGSLSADDSQTSLTLEEAQLLCFRLQQFYLFGSEKKLKLMEQFKNGDLNFDLNSLIEEADSLDHL